MRQVYIKIYLAHFLLVMKCPGFPAAILTAEAGMPGPTRRCRDTRDGRERTPA